MMTEYNLKYLEQKGFSGKPVEDVFSLTNGRKYHYSFFANHRTAFLDDVPKDDIIGAVNWLRTNTLLDIYWFWDGTRLCVYRNLGENRQFIFNTEHGMPSEYTRGKTSKLSMFSVSNTSVLFETSEVVNRFYRRLWELRLSMAKSIRTHISDRDRLLFSQRMIDRLVFVYFLVEKGIIRPTNGKASPRQLFSVLSKQRDFHELLVKIFFRYLNARHSEPLVIDSRRSLALVVPYLNGGLFKERILKTPSGDIKESQVDLGQFDWAEVIDEFNRYNWLIDDYTSDEPSGIIGNLTPEILGHIYERFVIAVSELDTINLSELVTDSKGLLRLGRKKIGAYYTPSAITDYMAERSILRYIQKNLSTESPSRTRGDLFNSLSQTNKESCDQLISGVRILDPSVGSGAFLLAAAKKLLEIRRFCGCSLDEYSLRREIIVDNLYGVDILEDAAEICMLRLWLWLAASFQIDKPVEQLPNIDFNIRRGNSLLGVVKYNVAVGDNETLDEDKFRSKIEDYLQRIEEYKHSDKGGKEPLIRRMRGDMQTVLNEHLASVLKIQLTSIIKDMQSLETMLKNITSETGEITIRSKSKLPKRTATTLQDLGFTVNEKHAKRKIGFGSPAQKKSVRDAFETVGSGSVLECKRLIHSLDLEELNAFHWWMEFPSLQNSDRLFDIVIGNPPHGARLTDIEQGAFCKIYSLSSNRTDIAKYFIERSYELTESILSFVVPKSCTYTTKWDDLRRFVADKLTCAVDLGTAFQGVNHEQVILELERNRSDDYYSVGSLDNNGAITELGSLPIEGVSETIPIILSEDDKHLLEELWTKGLSYFGDMNLRIFRGEKTDLAERGVVCLKGEEVQRYHTRPSKYRIPKARIRQNILPLYKRPKVMAQRIVAHISKPHGHLKIAAVYDEDNISYETVINIVPESRQEALIIVALLNSSIVNWYVYIYLFNRGIRDLDFDTYYIKRIPYPTMTDEEAELVATLSTACSMSHEHGDMALHRALERLTDDVCCELYIRPKAPSVVDQLLAHRTDLFGIGYGDDEWSKRIWNILESEQLRATVVKLGEVKYIQLVKAQVDLE